MASLVATIIIGRINRDKVNDPAKRLPPKCKVRTKISSPKMPYMTDGTPAKLVILTSHLRLPMTSEGLMRLN